MNEELNVEWGGIYPESIDAMHFSLNKKLLENLTNK